MTTITIKKEINSSLELNSAASDFLDKINKLSDDYVEVDFEGIIFVSRAFAQIYYSKKTKMDKNIVEINVPEEIKPLLKIIEKEFA
jgi:hypothetical protein